jgi:hypothetical protein
MHKYIETDVNIYDVTLKVSGDYYAEEPRELYDGNMEGYPGSGAEFDIQSIELEGINIIDLLSDIVIELIREKVIENQEN